jgi:hypothetical protein
LTAPLNPLSGGHLIACGSTVSAHRHYLQQCPGLIHEPKGVLSLLVRLGNGLASDLPFCLS